MFQLICDPAGVVVDTTLKELVPALIKWGNKSDHMLSALLSHILSSAQVYWSLQLRFFLSTGFINCLIDNLFCSSPFLSGAHPFQGLKVLLNHIYEF